MVKIPGRLVDYIIVHPGQMQIVGVQYNPYYSGEMRASRQSILDSMQALIESKDHPEFKRPPGDRVITRRAALEIQKDDIINLGLGMPMNVGVELTTMPGLTLDDFTFSVEIGQFGGVPAGDALFGASVNADMLFNQWEQFEFYEGGGISVTFVGAMQVDRKGNVNVVGVNGNFKGVGGFNYVTQNADRVVFCTRLLTGSGYTRTDDGSFVLNDRGAHKFVEEVECISLNADVSIENKQKVLYVTERCVFELTPGGLMLTEVSPYADLEKDVLAHMDFRPLISENLKKMDDICFRF